MYFGYLTYNCNINLNTKKKSNQIKFKNIYLFWRVYNKII